MKTRNRKPTAASKQANLQDGDETRTATSTLAPAVATPPNVFILPKDTSPAARIISANLSVALAVESRRLLVCPQRGVFEFTRVNAPKRKCRSWLLAPENAEGQRQRSNSDAQRDQGSKDQCYVLQSPDLLVATPLDPLFLLLAVKDVLWPNCELGRPEFSSLERRISTLRLNCDHIDQLLRDNEYADLEKRLMRRMEDVCDVLDLGDEQSYCLSLQKLSVELIHIATRAVDSGIPRTMDDQFVKQPLQVPELSIKREDSTVSFASKVSTHDGESEISSECASQSIDVSISTIAGASTAPTSMAGDDSDSTKPSNEASEEVKNLLRIRTVLQYLMASYLPSDLWQRLQEIFDKSVPKSIESQDSLLDFTPLDNHLSRISSLKKEAQALRSLSDNISRKRTETEDGEALEKADAKRRKKEEEEFKKKNTSRGVQQLAKVNTDGMKKLSAFFTKGPAVKK